MQNKHVLLNGELIQATEAVLPAGCRSVTLGESCFETVRVYPGNRVLDFEGHLNRMMRGAVQLGYDEKRHGHRFLPSAVPAQILKLIERENLSGNTIRVRMQTGRLDDQSIRESGAEDFYLLITAGSYSPSADPLKVRISQRERSSPAAADNSVKWSWYAPAAMELRETQQLGYDEALLGDGSGGISSCATANVFFIKDDAVATPWLRSGALHGITRFQILKMMTKAGIPFDERQVSTHEARSCDAAFITNSLREIAPVSCVNEYQKDAKHPLILRLKQLFEDYKSHHLTPLEELGL